MWVFDATPLIYLAKAGRLDIVTQLDGRRVVPEPVYDEVVTAGIDGGYPDARRIEQSTQDGVFEAVSVEEDALTERLASNAQLSKADGAVLTVAKQHDAVAVMDEAYGRDVAATEGITTRGTAYLVLWSVKHGALSRNEARKTLDAIIDAGWYCATDTYAALLRKLEAVGAEF